MDLDEVRAPKNAVIASACKVIPVKENTYAVEGIANTPAIVLLRTDQPPKSIRLGNTELKSFEHSAEEKLLWIKFQNQANPRMLEVVF